MKALVYVNHGRLVAECPVRGCGDARKVEIGEYDLACVEGHICELEWPDGIAQILAALDERTSDTRKNWWPKNHPVALATGQPHGQTVRELRKEAEAGETADAEHLASRRARILAELRAADIPIEDVLDALKGA